MAGRQRVWTWPNAVGPLQNVAGRFDEYYYDPASGERRSLADGGEQAGACALLLRCARQLLPALLHGLAAVAVQVLNSARSALRGS